MGVGENRRGRPRAGLGRLTRERILRSALRVVDEEGMGALSMRRLGAELGVDPMSIYHHLPGKEAVVSGLVRVVFGEMRVPSTGSGTWREQVRGFARAHRDLARAHPNLVLQIVSNAAASTEAMLEVSEPLYEALEAAGLPPRGIVGAADLVVDYVHGFALGEVAAPAGPPGYARVLLEMLEERPAGELPAMRRVFGSLAREEWRDDFDSGFEFGLDVIVAGIERVARGG